MVLRGRDIRTDIDTHTSIVEQPVPFLSKTTPKLERTPSTWLAQA